MKADEKLSRPPGRLLIYVLRTALPIQRFNAAERGRRDGDALERYAHMVPVVHDRNRAVYVVIAAARSGRRVRRRLTQLVGVLPVYLYDQVVLAVVVEAGVEGPAEPCAAFGVDFFLTPTVDLHRRIAAVVGLEVVRQLRERRVAQADFEIVIGARFVLGPREVAAPLPLRYRARGDGVGR